MNIIGKPRGVWPTFVSFPGAHVFHEDGRGLMYRHASATWDEPNPEEKERAMGFQIGTTSHTKVTRLEHNVLLGNARNMLSLMHLEATRLRVTALHTKGSVLLLYGLSYILGPIFMAPSSLCISTTSLSSGL
jgi:hypothetical protein